VTLAAIGRVAQLIGRHAVGGVAVGADDVQRVGGHGDGSPENP
jgi:hypothetical protein